MINSEKLITFLIFITIDKVTSPDSSLIVSLTEEFQMKNPIIVENSLSLFSFQLIKRLFLSGHSSLVTFNFSDDTLKTFCENDVPVIISFKDFKKLNLDKNMCWSSSIIIFHEESELEFAIQSIEVTIEKNYIFLIDGIKEVYEAYKINGKIIKQNLGYLSQLERRFVWIENIEKDFIKRRSNFHGIILKAMTDVSGNEIAFDPKYPELATYFSNNETYEMTNYTTGIYIDVLNELQNALNFSTIIYKRKVLAWGFVYPQENGSVIATGIVGDLFYNKVDLIVAPMAIFYRRALYIDYLLPITRKIIGLYIPTTSEENFDFLTFLNPFR